MANQRKADKKKVGVWLTDSEQVRMRRKIESAGFGNMAEWIRSLINDDSSCIQKKDTAI